MRLINQLETLRHLSQSRLRHLLAGFSLLILAAILILFGRTLTPGQIPGQASFAAEILFHSESVCLAPSITAESGFFLLLSTGLLTGLSHCVGMCGPLVGAFVARRGANPRPGPNRLSSPLVSFQLGRLTTYMLIGAVMGGLGSIFNFAAALRGWQGLLAIGLGSLLVVVGLGLLKLLPTHRLIESVALARFISRAMKTMLLADHPLAPFGLGLANGLLPCGAVYALSLVAASTGQPLAGSLVMLIFGLGTLPAMLGLGFSISMFSLSLRTTLFRLAAGLIILVGLQLILRGLALSDLVPHAVLGGIMLW